MKLLTHYFLRFLFGLSVLGTLYTLTQCKNPDVDDKVSLEELKSNFESPPDDVKPWLYWYWINNHISKKGITKDLEAMAELGIGAALIGNIYLNNNIDGEVPMLSEEWMELTQHAIREGGRLGVDIGLFNSPGWSQSGGPWNDESNSMRYLASSETQVQGGQSVSLELSVPTEDFQDVNLLAYPTLQVKEFEKDLFTLSSDAGLAQLYNLIDNDLSTEFVFSDLKELELIFSAKHPQTLRSLKIVPSQATFMMDVKLLAQEHGNWKEIRSFKFDKRSNMDQLSFQENTPVIVALPEVEADKFKLEFKNIQPAEKTSKASLAEVVLSPKPQLDFYLEKQLAKMHQTPLPLDDAYTWPPQKELVGENLVIDHSKIIDISSKLSHDGILNWDVPEGDWTILRTGMATTGIENGPAAPNATGLEVDKINRKALNKHFESFVGDILASMPEEERLAFKYVIADSYETGSQNWTDDFQESFQKVYGYDPNSYLPVFTGSIVNSVEESNRFLWDLRRLVADKVAYEYVGGLRELSEEHGLEMWLENYGHWGFPSEFLMYGGQSHLIGGEFWAEGDLGSIECRAASSAAHIYGKNQVSAESYTAGGEPFMRHPGRLKQRGDWSFTEGINHVVFHVYIQQAYDSLPGVNAWFGTEFNRHNTWFKESKPWIDYQRRCQYMLQQGRYVADIAYFIGEDAPKMTGVTNPELPEGYSFDYINAEVIKDRVTVKEGRITLPDGLSYKILVLPDVETMRPELLEKIEKLVSEGAVIMGNPPKASPSLENFSTADEQVKSLSKKMWGENFEGNSKIISYKKGKILPYMDLGKALEEELETFPDFKTDSKQPVLWIHRQMKDKDIYFITNQSDEKIALNASFRVDGMQPEFWEATTGETRTLPEYQEDGIYTSIPLELDASESGFVVFSNSKEINSAENLTKNFPEMSSFKILNQNWKVEFTNDDLGVREEVEMQDLVDWTSFTSEEIKYFSGTATYTTNFVLEDIPSAEQVFMDIGMANIMANIRLNGEYAGTLWTAPWKVDVTNHLKKGENQLQIEVTNLWVNQLIRDGQRSKDDKHTWTLQPNRYKQESELQPSGLEGPVHLLSY